MIQTQHIAVIIKKQPPEFVGDDWDDTADDVWDDTADDVFED